MRLQEIIKENLEWGNDTDKDIFMSLKGLVNKNNGVWKSTKQRWFVTNKLIYPDDMRTNRGKCKDWYGVDFDPDDGEKFVTVDAVAVWAHGARGQVPVRYGFVIDDFGVKKYYKIGNKGNLRDGAQPDPKKTKLEWERPENVDVEHLMPDPEEEKARKKKEFLGKVGLGAGAYVGEEGKRLEIGEVELIASKVVDSRQVAYNVVYDKYWNMYKRVEDDAIIYHTGKESPLEKGQKAIMTATVKKHLINKKGDRVTVVKIPKFKDTTGD